MVFFIIWRFEICLTSFIECNSVKLPQNLLHIWEICYCNALWMHWVGNHTLWILWGLKSDVLFVSVTVQEEVCIIWEPHDVKTPGFYFSSAADIPPKRATPRCSIFPQWLIQLHFVRKQLQLVTDFLAVLFDSPVCGAQFFVDSLSLPAIPHTLLQHEQMRSV
jgi:hypothetical protein